MYGVDRKVRSGSGADGGRPVGGDVDDARSGVGGDVVMVVENGRRLRTVGHRDAENARETAKGDRANTGRQRRRDAVDTNAEDRHDHRHRRQRHRHQHEQSCTQTSCRLQI